MSSRVILQLNALVSPTIGLNLTLAQSIINLTNLFSSRVSFVSQAGQQNRRPRELERERLQGVKRHLEVLELKQFLPKNKTCFQLSQQRHRPGVPEPPRRPWLQHQRCLPAQGGILPASRGSAIRESTNTKHTWARRGSG